MKRNISVPIEASWFDMVNSGEKLEEYREISLHWLSRFMLLPKGMSVERKDLMMFELKYCNPEEVPRILEKHGVALHEIDTYTMINGYGAARPLVRWAEPQTFIRKGKPAWGAPEDRNVFVVHANPGRQMVTWRREHMTQAQRNFIKFKKTPRLEYMVVHLEPFALDMSRYAIQRDVVAYAYRKTRLDRLQGAGSMESLFKMARIALGNKTEPIELIHNGTLVRPKS